MKAFWLKIHDKVKAAVYTALGLGLLAVVGSISDFDATGLGQWGPFAGAAIATLAAYAKKEINAFFLKATPPAIGTTLPPPVA